MTDNQLLSQRSLEHVWHPCTQMYHHSHEPFLPLVPIVRGEGVWLYDADGKRYLDAISSWWTNLFGHTNPKINAAIKAQVDQLEHVMFAGFTHPPAIELAERLAALTQLPRAFFASDGASAVEIALKMAFHFHANANDKNKKTKFVALEGSYHGETLGALGVTDVSIFRDAYGPLIATPLLVRGPHSQTQSPSQIQDSPCCEHCADDAAQTLRQLFTAKHNDIAAIIIEPLVQGAAGMRMTHPKYLQHVRALCDEFNVLMIADEIMTGFGRTGTMFACEQAGVVPDLMCLSKGLTGGYMAMSCVMASEKIFSMFDSPQVTRGFLHSHSYTGNPLACSAALATLKLFESDDVIACNQPLAARLNKHFQKLAEKNYTKDARHIGMIWACEIEHPRANDSHFARNIFKQGLENGVIIRPIGNTVYFMPPYIITEDEFATAINATVTAIETVLHGDGMIGDKQTEPAARMA